MKERLQRLAASLLLILLVAFAARVVFAWSQARKIPPQILRVVAFQSETGHIAYSLASGKGFSSPFQRDTGPTAWLAPVYPGLLAAIFKIFGVYTLRSLIAALALNIFFSAATCVPLFYAGQRIAGRAAGAAAAWLWALFPNAIIIPFEWIWDTSLSAFLVAALLWATLELADSPRFVDWSLYGLLWGFALLTNPAIALLLPVFAGWALFRRCTAASRAKNWLSRPALAVGLAALCCVPWTVRNYLAFHKFIPLRSNLPFELYIGNNENYDPQNRFRPAAITHDREILRYFRLGETAFMEEEQKKALAFIAAHPRVELWLISQRFVDFWLGTVTPLEALRQAGSLWIRFVLLFSFAVPFGALLGILALLLQKNAYAFPLVAALIVFPLLYYATHTSLRYRHPLDPVLLLLTAVGFHGAWRLVVGKRKSAEPSPAPLPEGRPASAGRFATLFVRPQRAR